MGHPRLEDDDSPPGPPADDIEYARFVGAGLAEAWSRRTPPLQARRPRDEPTLKAQAAQADLQAIAEGRKTPRPATLTGTAAEDMERARAERIARLAADDEARLELKRAKRSQPDGEG